MLWREEHQSMNEWQVAANFRAFMSKKRQRKKTLVKFVQNSQKGAPLFSFEIYGINNQVNKWD